ncbi:MAG TPA: class I SAM-dependent methyltransferase [Nanoarchaeota archaeon]|nr:class I SAM-dependent methyltransferase [Nanoarchaeota archaeon]
MAAEKDLQKKVIEEFSGMAAVKKYTKEALSGLWESEEKLIKRYFKKGSSVIDIGCGTGRTTIPLFRMGYKVTGLDITPKFIEIAKRIAGSKRLKIKYVAGDAAALKFKEGSFENAMFSFNGWTQIPMENIRLKALAEIYRVLKPRGCFIFTTHIRSWKGFTKLWLKQFAKIYILKPVGFHIEEIDFGDVFFSRDPTAEYSSKQFIHIPNVSHIRRLLEKTGFSVVLMAKRSEIAPGDSTLASGNCMFYVCIKPE